MEKIPFPVQKSFLDEKALARRLEAEYGLTGAACQLITASMRDVYLVTSGERLYAFYIYRCNQRSPVEIRAEWKFVDYLDTHEIPVAPAIYNREGELLITFVAPEGTRYGVLTPFVSGAHLRHRPMLSAITTYGQMIARIHALADEMPFALDRPRLDEERLINRYLEAFDSVITADAEDRAYFHQAAATLAGKIAALPREKPLYGMIHGDVIRANAQVSDEGQVTVLDFDLCGYGWRAYDVASYLQVVKGLPDQDESERAFLGGYQEIRSLTTFEKEALPLFGAVRTVFDIGVKSANVHHWGSAYLHAFLPSLMNQLRQCMQRMS